MRIHNYIWRDSLLVERHIALSHFDSHHPLLAVPRRKLIPYFGNLVLLQSSLNNQIVLITGCYHHLLNDTGEFFFVSQRVFSDFQLSCIFVLLSYYSHFRSFVAFIKFLIIHSIELLLFFHILFVDQYLVCGYLLADSANSIGTVIIFH